MPRQTDESTSSPENQVLRRFKTSNPKAYITDRKAVPAVEVVDLDGELIPFPVGERSLLSFVTAETEDVSIEDVSSIEISPATVFKLAAMHCDDDEIAAFLDLPPWLVAAKKDRSHRLYDAEFEAAWNRGRKTGKTSLRRAQFVNAVQRGNVAMQMHLGKHYLGQIDAKAETNPVGDRSDDPESTAEDHRQMAEMLNLMVENARKRAENAEKAEKAQADQQEAEKDAI